MKNSQEYKSPRICTYESGAADMIANSVNTITGDAGYGGGTTADPRVKEDFKEDFWDFSWEK